MKNGGQEIQLIERSVALADDRPLRDLTTLGTPSAKGGFKMRAIPHAGELFLGPDRFGVCAFPAPIDQGRHGTYLLQQNNVVYKKILGHALGVDVHPTEAQLKEQEWEILN